MRMPFSDTRLRLWPGVLIVVLQWLIRFGGPLVDPDLFVAGMIAGVAGGLAVVIWWLLFSRAPWLERIGALVVMVAGVAATKLVVHESISGGGMGMMIYILSIPVLSLALVAWAVATRHLAAGPRRAGLLVATVLACSVFTLLRTDGVTGEGASQLAWRWTPTPEELLLAREREAGSRTAARAEPAAPRATPAVPSDSAAPPADAPKAPVTTGVDASGPVARAVAPVAAPNPSPTATPNAASTAPEHRAASTAASPDRLEDDATPAEWPGFRGPERNGIVRGVRIETDWSASPPAELWRRAVGPGWSSFAVRGDLLYTQEQRGEEEVVSAYRVGTGELAWRHSDAVRFWESNGGPGPRSTPTLDRGRVFTFGATGVLNALDARNGAVLWSRNAASDTHRRIPDWGFASSPLVEGELVIVAVSGTLAAYDLATGEPRWVGPQHGGSYSSPQRSTIDGVPQILLLSGAGATSVAPSDGKLLWEHEWEGSAIVQPALTAEGDVVINSIAATGGLGTRRLAIAHQSGGWQVQERWTSNGLKPYFNDFVVHKGHAFGFDGHILACIDLEDGKRIWKGGRYGNGQLVLLPEQDLLLVLSEDGDLALVSATPDRYKEIARVPALEGKTWNHPVLVRDILLVRNGESMAAFRIPLADR
jgi:outer membrane protein assembly factor BamB